MKKGELGLNRWLKDLFIYFCFFLSPFLPLKLLFLGWYFVMKELLESIAKTTGGMHVMVHNMDELSTFFRRQVLLSRFIAQTAHGEWHNEYFFDNCQDMLVCTVGVGEWYVYTWKILKIESEQLLIPSRNRFLEILPDERHDFNSVFIRFQVWYRVYTISLQSHYLMNNNEIIIIHL